jgi:putative DNA primase/helicase
MAVDATAVIRAAEGNWFSLLQGFGIDEKFLRNRHGPCPACGGDDRFRFDDKGKGMHFCSGCGAGDGVDLLRKFLGQSFRQIIDQLAERLHVTEEEDRNDPARRQKLDLRGQLEEMWEGAKPIDGTDPASCYLKSRVPSLRRGVARVLRYHPRLSYIHEDNRRTFHPGMLAAIQGADGRMVALHRTYLSADGKKANVPEAKKTTQSLRSISGAAIRLAQPRDGVIAVAEGIETALAVQQLYGAPCWATISSGGMTSFDWRAAGDIRALMIFADNDENFAGHAAAYALAHRARKAGLTCNVILPDLAGEDFADQLAREVAA